MRRENLLVAAVACVALAACKRSSAAEDADGAALFAASCARCHGTGGGGGLPVADGGPSPRNFHDAAFQASRTDEQIKNTIVQGKGGYMPPFGNAFDDGQLRALVAQVRKFGGDTMKYVKWALAILGGVLVLGVLALVLKFYVLSPKKRPPPEVKAPNTPEAIARGKYLASSVMACVGCHSPVQEDKSGEPLVEGKQFSGRDFGHPEFFPGLIRARNLTPDPDTGIGGWTDGELLRAMREGVGKDGHAMFPMMPYLTYAQSMSDDDGLAIVAYLRTLAPIKNDVGRTELRFPVSMFIRAAPQPLEKSPPAAPTGSGIERGNWLLAVASCADCHTSYDAHRQPIPGRYLAGGNAWPIPGKGTVYTANITSDKATGIGAYSDDDLLRILNEGVGKAGRALYGMPWPYYKGMTDDDKKALIAALRAVPPITNVVPAAQLK